MNVRPTSIVALGAVGAFLCACPGEDADNPFDSASASASATATEPGSASNSASASNSNSGPTEGTDSASGTGEATGSGSDSADDTGDGPKLDVSVPDTPPACGTPDDPCDGCTYVDLLFVIDNSGSMGDYQQALSLAFPAFAGTLIEALPPGTNVHVGVTSTEMGYSGMGSTSVNNGMCTFIGDDNQPNDAFYITPEDMDSGRNGAQGRLYDPGGGETFFEFTTDAGAGEIQALEEWFSMAANIGEGGSNIEMSTAPVGWFADPVNDATNAGFLRDEGAVLVVFFVQDEPDQTPMMIDGKGGGQAMLDRLLPAKAGCGGLDCIIAGGFLNANACNADGNLPLDDFLAAMTIPPQVQPLPDENTAEDNPQQAADEMNEHLSNTLADVIAQTCDSIPPAG